MYVSNDTVCIETVFSAFFSIYMRRAISRLVKMQYSIRTPQASMNQLYVIKSQFLNISFTPAYIFCVRFKRLYPLTTKTFLIYSLKKSLTCNKILSVTEI